MRPDASAAAPEAVTMASPRDLAADATPRAAPHEEATAPTSVAPREGKAIAAMRAAPRETEATTPTDGAPRETAATAPTPAAPRETETGALTSAAPRAVQPLESALASPRAARTTEADQRSSRDAGEAPSRRPRRALAAVALAAGVLGAWALVASLDVGGRPVLAGPWATARVLVEDAPLLLADLAATFLRAAAGLALGALAGVVLGVLVVLAARLAPGADALLDVGRSVPPVVWLPVFLLALGYNDGARVATVAAGVAVIMAVAVTTAARSPRSVRREVLALAGARGLRALRWTQPWESLPALLVGVRVSAAMAVVVATVSEMVAGAPRGVGARIVSAQVAGDTPQLTAAIVAVGVAGWAISRALRAAERAVAAWQGQEGHREPPA